MKAICVIPARYQSSRFPGKPLVDLCGIPLVVRVAMQASQAVGKEATLVATDDKRISDKVTQWGFNSIMTDSTHPTGTDRLWEVAQHVQAEVYVNVQGDEPLIDPGDIRRIIARKQETGSGVINMYCRVSENEDPFSVNLPKVIISESGRLVYMSRYPLPAAKSKNRLPASYLKQVCIYAFSHNELKSFGERGVKTPLEASEDIEILRFIEMDLPVYMLEARKVSLAVDVPEDVARVEQAIRNADNNPNQ